MMLVPGGWSPRNRPIMIGFIGVEVRHGAIRYLHPPEVRRADGQPVKAQLGPQAFEVYQPHLVQLETSRTLHQAELHDRFESTLDPHQALGDLTPPDGTGCGCSNTPPKVFFLPALMLFVRVRRAATPAGE